jgi:hypothetical protein
MLPFDRAKQSFSSPADVLGDGELDDGSKRLILRQWQHVAMKTSNPCDDPVCGPLLAEIGIALDKLAKTH